MKVKNFITILMFSFFVTGCQVTATDYLSHDNGLSEDEITLVASGVLGTYMSPTYYHTYGEQYYYDYDDAYIDSYIGNVSLSIVDNFYGYDHRNPYRGNIEIINDDMTIYLDVVDDYYVEVTLYDNYDSSYDRQFITTWVKLGF